MLLPANSIIATEKLTHYLLVPKLQNDKSLFLRKLGYTLETWEELEHDIRTQILPVAAVKGRIDVFGVYYEIYGTLRGYPVKTVWIWEHNEPLPRFITLYPNLP